MDAFQIIKKPILSEKAYNGIAFKKYVFVVDSKATKHMIKQAILSLYEGIKVQSVNTVSVKGKFKRQGKHQGYTSSYKKAYVQLTKDSKTIPFFDSLS